VCASCGDPLTGPFCARCGEQIVDRHSLTVWHFVSDHLLHEFTHLDSKIFRTFQYLLFRPGFLSEEYFAGRRRPYINPIRLLLTSVIIFALAGHTAYATLFLYKVRLNLLPPGTPSAASIVETAKRLDPSGMLSKLVDRVAVTKDVTSAAAVERFHHDLKTFGTALSFGNVVLLGGLLFVMFHRRRPLFVEHLVFSLHLASFVLLFSVAASWAFNIAGRSGQMGTVRVSVVLVVFLVAQITYLYLALRRFYYRGPRDHVRWWQAAAWFPKVAVVIVLIGNSFFITLVYAIGGAIALARL
jgi:hypothetical protein